MKTRTSFIRAIALMMGTLMLVGCFVTSCSTVGDAIVETTGAATTDGETSGAPAPDTESPTTEEQTPTDTTDPAGNTDEDPALNVFPNSDRNIELAVFYEPSAEYTTPEQFDYLRDAHITLIEQVNPNTSLENQKLQAQLAAERGIEISWNGYFDGISMTDDSSERIMEYTKEIASINSSIQGIHIKDEPAQPWLYANAIASVKQAGLRPYFNFLPFWATENFENYNGHVEDCIIATGKDNFGYLRYDHYPFENNNSDPNPNIFYNLELFRQIGLKYDLPTGFYLQSTGWPPNNRRATADEIRYYSSAGLAYGIKHMSYFTWWSVSDDPNYAAIITHTGEKSDLYDDVADINGQIRTVGPVLAGLDALEIYHTLGREWGVTACSSKDVPIYAKGSNRKYGYIISLMEDKETGRDYIMIVNKNTRDEATNTFTVSNKITHLYNLNNGTYEEIDISDGTVDITLAPGGFILLAVGQHDNIVDRVYDKSANLAEGKAPAVDAVNPGYGYYAYCLTDGKRDDLDYVARGYRSPKATGWIEVDLNRVTTLNRVDLYPTGTNYTRGKYFPLDFTIEVSADGEKWICVVEKTNYTDVLSEIPSFTFDAVEARYVRINVTKSRDMGYFEIAEIEIYNDDGSVPAPNNAFFYADVIGKQPAGSNVALGRDVAASSYVVGWDPATLTNGSKYMGWISGRGRHGTENGDEWFTVDLDYEYELDRIVLYAQENDTYFPKLFRIEVSSDGKTFETVYDGALPET